MNPQFRPGKNIAMKVPAHEYERTVSFYRGTLGLNEIQTSARSATESTRFEFGGKVLWLDRVEGISQAEIWLEVIADDLDEAAEHLRKEHCVRCDEIEALPDGVDAFWISSPANIIHLVASSDD